jgi:hypothetical protein
MPRHESVGWSVVVVGELGVQQFSCRGMMDRFQAVFATRSAGKLTFRL